MITSAIPDLDREAEIESVSQANRTPTSEPTVPGATGDKPGAETERQDVNRIGQYRTRQVLL